MKELLYMVVVTVLNSKYYGFWWDNFSSQTVINVIFTYVA